MEPRPAPPPPAVEYENVYLLEEPEYETFAAHADETASEPAAATPMDNKPRSPAEFPSATPNDTPASYLSLGISGLKDPKTESPGVGNLAAYLDDLNVEASPRPALGDASNAESAPEPEVVKPAIVATGPAAEWRGTHVRF